LPLALDKASALPTITASDVVPRVAVIRLLPDPFFATG
jgi:hypothetical protein